MTGPQLARELEELGVTGITKAVYRHKLKLYELYISINTAEVRIMAETRRKLRTKLSNALFCMKGTLDIEVAHDPYRNGKCYVFKYTITEGAKK